MRRVKVVAMLVPVMLVMAVGLVAVVQRAHVDTSARASASSASSTSSTSLAPGDYVYYVLKQSKGFVLARAVKGSAGQPVGAPQVIASFSDAFGQVEGDAVLSMQLSPDGKYLAIDGTRDHGEQVWVYDTEHMVMRLTPANVMGNFLHWLPSGDRFLYRPMFPMGPDAPMDGNNGWNPGLWIVNAATGSHLNINIHMPSAFLVDAASSPDGTRIVYSTSEGLGQGSNIWLMNSNGSNQRHLFHLAGGAQSIAGLFSWSPDGKRIAYERISDSPVPFVPAGLWIMNGVGSVGSVGSGQRFLAQADGGHGYAPVWSPDGTRIAFVERTNLGNHQADTSAQALQCGIAVADVASGRSWFVASPQQTHMQININPTWAASSDSITFTSFSPMNTLIGATPHYWSAAVVDATTRPAVRSLSAPEMRIFAVG